MAFLNQERREHTLQLLSTVIVTSVFWVTISVLPVQADQIVRFEDIVQQVAPPSRNVTRGIGVEPTDSSPFFRKISLPTIQFEFDSAWLTNIGELQLSEVAKALNSDTLSRFFFAIQGYTDGTGSESYNRGLSLRRADSVKRWLSSRKVSPDRLVEVGLGENFPLPGIPAEDAKNRRVQIVNLGVNRSINPREEKPVGAKRALLIGIDEYQHISSLAGPVNDVVQMTHFLKEEMDYEERDIKTLLDEQATREQILASIKNWLVDGTVPGDEIFMFFSGHGFQQPDKNGDEDDGYDETLVPVDTRVDDAGRTHGMISDDEIGNLMNQLSGRRINVVIDSCHSGTGTREISNWRYVKTPRLPDGTPLKVAPVEGRREKSLKPEFFLTSGRPDMFVWTAVRPDQKALMDEEVDGESVFTRRLLSGMKDKTADWDGDGIVTARELHRYVLEKSDAYCKRHFDICLRGLTPQLYTQKRQLDKPAFGLKGDSLPRVVALAKDILVKAKPGEHKTDMQEDVQLRMNPGKEVALDTEIQVVVESNRNGWLILLDIDAAGRLTQIFPNNVSVRNGTPEKIQAGSSVTLPGEKKEFLFKTTPPAGVGMLIAVVSEEDARLKEVLSQHKDLSVVPRPQAYLVELGETLLSGRGTKLNEKFAVASLEYEIVDSD